MIKLNKLLPPDLIDGVGEAEFHIPPWAFRPDGWSFAFLRGLRKLDLRGRVWEIGVGTGLNSLILRRQFPDVTVYFSDYNQDCTQLAVDNITAAERLFSAGYEPLHGQWDLVKHVDERVVAPIVDAIVACIPQVPVPPDVRLESGDSIAHYYDPKRYSEARLHAVGLGLNEALLQRAHRVLTSRGKVVLNLGGRPGLKRLEEMFVNAGYMPRVIHEEVVEQHHGTSLLTLAQMEGASHADFEFFADKYACESINAQQAETRRLDGLELYHKIYVIEGTRVT